MTRIAIYTRVSTDAQAEEHRTSLDEQLAACSDYAKAKDWQIVDRFSDVATGTSRADKRPGLKALFDAAARSEFDGVLSWKGDRLARGSGIAGDIEEALRPLNVFVAAVTEPLNLDLLGLWGWVGGRERQNLMERTSLGRIGAAKAGRPPAGAMPVGYRRGPDSKPVIHEPEAELVRRIYAESIAGRGVKQIADGLNLDGISTPSGHQWWASNIGYILRREVYTGSREYSGVAVPFPPIVPKSQWDKAQAARRKRTSLSGGRRPHVYMLSYLAECTECGRKFIARTKSKVSRAPLRYYLCGGGQVGVRCRSTRHIRAEKLEETVWTEVEGLLMSPELLRAALKSAKDSDELEEDIAQLRRDISRVDRGIDRLTNLFMRNRIEQARFDRLLGHETDRLTGLRERLADLEDQRDKAVEVEDSVDAVPAWARETAQKLPGLDATGRREIAQTLISGVTVDRAGNVVVTFRLPVSLDSKDAELEGQGSFRCSTSIRRTSPSLPGCALVQYSSRRRG